MILRDTVYQRVQALANKEQRGYITPKDFNLFAEQAQLEIIDQYYYDLNLFNRRPGNSEEYSDIIELIEEKIGYLTKTATLDSSGNLPSDFYRLGSVITGSGGIAQKVSIKEYSQIENLLHMQPGDRSPVYYWSSNKLVVKPDTSSAKISYIKKPDQPIWGYVVINKKPLHNPNANKTVNFSLHKSEEPELVYRILTMAGISIQKPQLTQIAATTQLSTNQQEKQ